MTQFSILGPPLHGRRVKSEKEVLEEIALAEFEARNNPQTVLVPDSPPSDSPKQVAAAPTLPPRHQSTPKPSIQIPLSTPNSYFIAPGRFALKDISLRGIDYVFHGLKLPMGSWKELVLDSGSIMFSPRTFKEWETYTSDHKTRGVIPADVLYGLMAVCYLNRARKGLVSVIRDIKSRIFYEDANTRFPLTSTAVRYNISLPASVNPGAGWPISHPFNNRYDASIAGQDSFLDRGSITSNPSVASAIKGLLGEDDLCRFRFVLGWAMGATPVLLSRNCTPGYGDHWAEFYTSTKPYSVLRITPEDNKPHAARCVAADPKYYLAK